MAATLQSGDLAAMRRIVKPQPSPAVARWYVIILAFVANLLLWSAIIAAVRSFF